MKKFLFIFLTLISSSVYSQIDIDKERVKMHKEFLERIEQNQSRSLYEDLCNLHEAAGDIDVLKQRVRLGWILGKVNSLKTDIPRFLNHEEYASRSEHNYDYRTPISIENSPGSEWQRQSKMAAVLYDYFVEQSDSLSALLMLKIKVEAGHFLDDDLNYINDVKLLLPQLEDDDSKRYLKRRMWLLRYRLGHKDYGDEFFLNIFSETKDVEDLRPLFFTWNNEKNYKEMLKYKDAVIADSSYHLKAMLAECALNSGDSLIAQLIYDDFKKRLEYMKYMGHYSVPMDGMNYVMDFTVVSNIADFYSKTDPDYSCKLYNGIITGIPISNSDKFDEEYLLNRLVAITDEEKIKKILAEDEDIKKQKKIIMEHAKSKVLECH